MLLNSLQFLWFFPLVTILWFSVGQRFRQYVLLSASIWFYVSWQPIFLPVLLACIVAAWFGGLYMQKPGTMLRRFATVISVLVPLAMLLFFKYYSFIIESALAVARRIDSSTTIPHMRIALPVGISFFTFKAISYLVDVRRDRIVPEKSILAVANYIAFFPQLLAGPIERAGNFIPQLAKKHVPDPGRFRDGCALILWGLFKKAVIADNLAVIVNQVYGAPQDYPGLGLIIATYCYAFQIFCDFSGYSDMAIGVARILGFNTMANFNRPYAAVSVTDFWRRWHISLSTWFRDYLYIPLGGNRTGYFRWVINVLIVFLVSGLWHGASWTFALWGALHGAFIVGERFIVKPLETAGEKFPRIVHGFRVLMTFHLVTFAWIFFRASSISDALYVAGNLFNGVRLEVLNLFAQADLVRAAILILILLTGQALRKNGSGLQWLRARPVWIRWAIFTAMVIAIINMRPLMQSGFIYLQF